MLRGGSKFEIPSPLAREGRGQGEGVGDLAPCPRGVVQLLASIVGQCADALSAFYVPHTNISPLPPQA
jgi:hypothetical protein